MIRQVTTEEIIEIINNLENKSEGPQSIPVKLLKMIPDIIAVPLCNIINQSFSTGVFPNALKISKVIPKHKGGSTEDPGYGPPPHTYLGARTAKLWAHSSGS